MAGLLEHVDRPSGSPPGAEVTLEVNPGPDDRGDLAGFRAAGVTRFSIGAQSLDDRLLRRLGRRHGARTSATPCARRARAGVAVGQPRPPHRRPRPVDRGLARTLDAALALEPDHLSVYALALDDPEAEGLTGPSGDHLPVRAGAGVAGAGTQRAVRGPGRGHGRAHRRAGRAAGLRRYEIANLARPGPREPPQPPLLAPSAVPRDRAGSARVRRRARALLERGAAAGYLDALRPHDGSAPRLPPGGHERVDAATAEAERAILGLRLVEGIDATSPPAPGSPPGSPGRSRTASWSGTATAFA